MYNDNRVKINIEIKVKNESRSRLRSKKSQNLINIERKRTRPIRPTMRPHDDIMIVW